MAQTRHAHESLARILYGWSRTLGRTLIPLPAEIGAGHRGYNYLVRVNLPDGEAVALGDKRWDLTSILWIRIGTSPA